jgi:chemotaxis protein MotB
VPAKPSYGAWELSVVRQILSAGGLPSGHIFEVAGKADTDPLFPDPTCRRTAE